MNSTARAKIFYDFSLGLFLSMFVSCAYYLINNSHFWLERCLDSTWTIHTTVKCLNPIAAGQVIHRPDLTEVSEESSARNLQIAHCRDQLILRVAPKSYKPGETFTLKDFGLDEVVP